MAKTPNLRNQFELILNYTQSLTRELAQLPVSQQGLVILAAELSPREREELDHYLGTCAVSFGQMRESFLALRHALKG